MLTTLHSHSWKKRQAVIELATCHWSPHLCGVHIRKNWVKTNKWKDSSELELWSKEIWGRNDRFLLRWFLCLWIIETEGGRPVSWCYDYCQFLMSCSILKGIYHEKQAVSCSFEPSEIVKRVRGGHNNPCSRLSHHCHICVSELFSHSVEIIVE